MNNIIFSMMLFNFILSFLLIYFIIKLMIDINKKFEVKDGVNVVTIDKGYYIHIANLKECSYAENPNIPVQVLVLKKEEETK